MDPDADEGQRLSASSSRGGIDRDGKRKHRSSSPPTYELDTKKSSNSAQFSQVNGQSDAIMSMKPLSLSILGVEPIDEFIREVADWVHAMIMNRPNIDGQIEVEAKLGILKYKDSNQRLQHPVRVETSA